jgi:hypothetical protein
MCSMKSSGVRALNCSHSAATTQPRTGQTGRDRVCAFEHFKSGQRDFLGNWIKRAEMRFRFVKRFSDFQRGGFLHSSVFGSNTRPKKSHLFPLRLSKLRKRELSDAKRFGPSHILRRPADNLGLTSSPRDEVVYNLLTSRIIVLADM